MEMDTCWERILKVLESNELDFPLAVMYSYDYSDSAVAFQGGLGIPQDHHLSIKRARLDQINNPLLRILQQARTAGNLSVFQHAKGEFPEGLFDDVSWRGFGEPSTVIAVLSLMAEENLVGFVLTGLNPRRAYDNEYDHFIQLLNRQLSVSLTSAMSIEQGRRRQAELIHDLAEEESRFKAMTELNTAG